MRTLIFTCIFALFTLFALPSAAQITDNIFPVTETIEYETVILKGELDFSIEQWRDSLYAKDVIIKMKVNSEADFNLIIYVYDENEVPFIYRDLGRKGGGVYEISVRINFYTNGRHFYDIWI